jgi:hypothetical protein
MRGRGSAEPSGAEFGCPEGLPIKTSMVFFGVLMLLAFQFRNFSR